jgi:NAD(P)-dependent dehydrogenase (short-subunit alcohol dehydrogenase family)
MAQHSTTARPTAFITGGSQGIGAAVAVALARDGYDVAISSRRPEALADTAAQVKAAGGRALPVELDVVSETGIERAMTEVLKGFGQLDLLVNNAGITNTASALEITPAEWEAVIATNLTGAFFMSQQMGRHLVATKRPGSIINIASTHGLVGMPNRIAYGSSKGGIIQMTRMLAIEWAQHGIRVNAIAPGRVETPSRASFTRAPGYREMMLKRVPLGRFANSEEVAAAVCYLASPAASYITGQTLALDGGLTAQ